MTTEFGWAAAKVRAERLEDFSRKLDKAERINRRMDLHNNRIGRLIGQTVSMRFDNLGYSFKRKYDAYLYRERMAVTMCYEKARVLTSRKHDLWAVKQPS